MKLRDYQLNIKQRLQVKRDSGVKSVMVVLPCRSGKSPLLCSLVEEEPGGSVVIAHRSELIVQLSITLARFGVRHRVIASPDTVKAAIRAQLLILGKSYYDANSRHAVASVFTLINYKDSKFINNVKLWVQDEGHHSMIKNSWGKCTRMFPHAFGVGFTATPTRSDGRGLGSHHDGVFDDMVVGPGMRELIDRGFIADYRVFCPTSDLDLSNVPVHGDFSMEPLRKALHKSRIIGDVVSEYLKIAPGKTGITFCVDVETAIKQAEAFRFAGVPADVLHGNLDSRTRFAVMKKLERGDLKQVTACDLISEGIDLPAIEVVSMERPTWSYGLFVQQFCRALTYAPGKVGLIIDHVNNIRVSSTIGRHVLPDAPVTWSLDRREKRTSAQQTSVVQIRVCPACTGVYERVLGLTCPHCGHKIEPQSRGVPEQVSGDLHELDPSVLLALRGQVNKNIRHPGYPVGATAAIRGAVDKQHRLRVEALRVLKQNIFIWMVGDIDSSKKQREFYLRFGVDVLTAQTLNRKEAEILNQQIIGANDVM